jgi:hypothetical protein
MNLSNDKQPNLNIITMINNSMENDNLNATSIVGNDVDMDPNFNDYNSPTQQHWTDLYSGLNQWDEFNDKVSNTQIRRV